MTTTITRSWSMPSRDTFSMGPVKEILGRWVSPGSVVVDPFARNSSIGTITNDLNPETGATHHLDARVFCSLLESQGIEADVVLFDPPYSPRQVADCYRIVGIKPTQSDTQNSVLNSETRAGLNRLLKPGGIAISFGWNSVGFGKKYGYELLEILMVCHGGAHNDTICVVERKPVPSLN